MIGFIEEHREGYVVEPICNVLRIAPSTYHERVAQRQDPSRLSQRAKRDRDSKPEIVRMFAGGFAAYNMRYPGRSTTDFEQTIATATASLFLASMQLIAGHVATITKSNA
jgi:putative transposase